MTSEDINHQLIIIKEKIKGSWLGTCIQYTRLHTISTNTGAPQGTEITPFLFALYTADCRSTDESCPLVNFSDHTEMIGKLVMMKMHYTTCRLKTLSIGVIKITCI